MAKYKYQTKRSFPTNWVTLLPEGGSEKGIAIHIVTPEVAVRTEQDVAEGLDWTHGQGTELGTYKLCDGKAYAVITQGPTIGLKRVKKLMAEILECQTSDIQIEMLEVAS